MNDFLIPISISIVVYIVVFISWINFTFKEPKKSKNILNTNLTLSASEIKEGWEIREVNGAMMKVLPREKLLRH